MDLTSKGFKKPLATEGYDIIIVNENTQLANDLIEGLENGTTAADNANKLGEHLPEYYAKQEDVGNKATLSTDVKTNLVAAINEVKEQNNSFVADYIRSPGYGVTTGSANIYALTLNPALAAYTAGVCVAVKINVANTGASTINVNGLGAKPIKDSKGNALVSGKLALNSVYTFRYDGTNFILQGEGGEYGTATAADALIGKTIGTDNGLVEGTIPSKAAATITPGTTNQTIAAEQYLSGVQTILGDADLVSANIKSGANIFNVAGKSSVVDTADATIPNEGYIYSGVTAYKNGAKLTGTMPLRGGTSVTLATQGASHTVPYGYHDGGIVTASFANLVAGNVKSGVNIGGVVGNVVAMPAYVLSCNPAIGATYINSSGNEYHNNFGTSNPHVTNLALFSFPFYAGSAGEGRYTITCPAKFSYYALGYSINSGFVDVTSGSVVLQTAGESSARIMIFNPTKTNMTITLSNYSYTFQLNLMIFIA